MRVGPQPGKVTAHFARPKLWPEQPAELVQDASLHGRGEVKLPTRARAAGLRDGLEDLLLDPALEAPYGALDGVSHGPDVIKKVPRVDASHPTAV